MAEITAALVKELREKSGVGMMDCKKALQENNGDIEASMDWLKTKGLAKAAKKSDRVAAEGLVSASVRADGAGMTGAVIELNAETDFVARNETFQNAARAIGVAALDQGELEALGGAKVASGESVNDMVTNMIATIGENMNLRRAKVLKVGHGVVASYMHQALKPGLGKIGVLVAVEGDSEVGALEILGKQVGMHVAATRPEALDTDDVYAAALELEKAVLTEQARASGKPDAIIEKMVEGRIRKY